MFPVELVQFFYYHEKHEMTRKEGVMTWVLGIGFRFLFEDHLREWRAGSKGVFGMLWRYRLIPGRCQAVPGRCRGEGGRRGAKGGDGAAMVRRWCGDGAATRRRTLRTSVVSGSANLEKTGCFAVKTWNKWPVFQCTVNWARARHS